MFRLLLPAISACVIVLLCASSSRAADAVPTVLPAPPGSEAEPNGTAATASPIQAGERIRATIYPAGDVDRYRFHAEAGDRVYAMTMTDGTASDDDTVMTLLGADGTTAIESDDHDGTQSAAASSLAGTAVPASGTYYLEVKGRRGTEWIRPYDLWLDVRSGAPATEAEPDDTLATANPLSGVVAGLTDPANDPDYYALTLGAGDSVFLSLDLDPDRDGATQNATLGFGPSLEELTKVDNTRSVDAGHSMAYTATVPSAGTYYVYVGGRGGAETTYQLSATVIPAVKRSCRAYPVAGGAIPDLGTATFPIDVPDAATVGHVALVTDLTHSYPPDIIATLESPAGLDVPVFGETGRNTDPMAVTWDDDAASAVVSSSLPARVLQSTQRGGLRAFDGQQAAGTWKLHLIDNEGGDTGALDHAALMICARPQLGPTETVFSATFEDGDDGFTHSGTHDEWERGTPATAPSGDRVAGLSGCAGGSQCFKTDLDGTYEASSSQDLVSPPISLAGRSGPLFVSWEMWHQLENADFDHATVSVEEDGGGSPRNLFTWLGPNPYLSRNIVEMKYGIGWNAQRADISEYAGKTIRLRFHLDSDRDINLAGLAIDDVRVVEVKPAPAQQAPESSDPQAPAATSPPATATAEERALSRLKLAKSCVRPSRSGRTRVSMTLRLAKPRPVQMKVERAVGSTGRGTCWKPNADSPRVPPATRWRPIALVGAARTASVTQRMGFNLRLKPGLYRLTVQLVLEDGKLSSPARRYLRVVAK